ncbi:MULTISPECIES: cation diffusion facilitator family transporter [Bacillaceae]|uniref:Cation diffusion facilitator family transporter n=1 Tax=Cytobacillus firmus TaxID=1399 RepID=A0AA46SE29_CYTFI|nr:MULTISPECIES: cation diffusion facilitator family transporter [Bacillaceae]KML40540.1 cation transporter [Cytobacillus firmus]MCC3647543.1 cation transporter [Cytobacillus oceanisediminis]MCS0654361.1 cation diffusion facilitator family transporter [Cytobacillus firmus]MCU1805450.1 cation diffusion facilitator family transporter [Cytobacillus firmus]UYG94431.1 cation diffusion facilitator family transporter [Cytobacillus firmus]
MENNDRFKKAEFAAIIGIVGNIILAALKWGIGVYSGSKALVADAVHSASDVAGSFAVYLGLRAAKQPPDEDHPYGHGKAELIAAIIVAVLLFLVGIEIGKSSFESFFSPIEPPKAIAIAAVVVSIVVKEAMFRYKYNLGKKLNSDALIVNAYEHRSDVYSSIAALIGIGCAIIGGRMGIEWLEYADPVAGLIVSLMILQMAWRLGKESIHSTLDHVLHEEDTLEMRKTAESVDHVKRIDELHAREHGHYVIVDIKVSVDPNMTVEDGHRVGKEVKLKLLQLENVQNVFVHINPFSEEHIN